MKRKKMIDAVYYNDANNSALCGDISDTSDFAQLNNLKELSLAGKPNIGYHAAV